MQWKKSKPIAKSPLTLDSKIIIPAGYGPPWLAGKGDAKIDMIPVKDQHFYNLYWECPECEKANHIIHDDCQYCEKALEPKRIQRKRSKGWRMPPDTVYVGRPGPWGNPFKLIENSVSHTREGIVELYAEVLERNETDRAKWVNVHIRELRGKNLACWCRLDQPCHADVLLRLANE